VDWIGWTQSNQAKELIDWKAIASLFVSRSRACELEAPAPHPIPFPWHRQTRAAERSLTATLQPFLYTHSLTHSARQAGKQVECDEQHMHLVRSKANKAEASASLRLIDMSVTSHSTPVTTPSDPFTSILLLVY